MTGPDDERFIVIMPVVLRERFDRWLMRNHLQMRAQQGSGPRVYVVSPPAKYGTPTIAPPPREKES